MGLPHSEIRGSQPGYRLLSSVPVLSWLFVAARRPPKQATPHSAMPPVPRPCADKCEHPSTHNPCNTARCCAASHGPTLRANPFPEVTDPCCRLPLSTLFYSTRGYSPWRPDAVISTAWHAEETYVRSLGFSWIVDDSPDSAKARCFPSPSTSSPANPFPRYQAVKKKRQLFPGPPPMSPSSFVSPPLRHIHNRSHSGLYSHAKCRDLNLLPFRDAEVNCLASRFTTGFPCPLGPTHPWPTAVPMEPFSTSAFKVLT